MVKKSGYKVDFTIDDLSMSQQEKVYQILMKNLDFQEKDNLTIKITDPFGGVHNIFEKTGIMPTGELCENCIGIDCGKCRIFLKALEREE